MNGLYVCIWGFSRFVRCAAPVLWQRNQDTWTRWIDNDKRYDGVRWRNTRFLSPAHRWLMNAHFSGENESQDEVDSRIVSSPKMNALRELTRLVSLVATAQLNALNSTWLFVGLLGSHFAPIGPSSYQTDYNYKRDDGVCVDSFFVCLLDIYDLFVYKNSNYTNK